MQILYSKCNSLRRPEYQIRTSIIEENGCRYVVKAPMHEHAGASLARMETNFDKLQELYQNIKLLPPQREGDCLKFDFLKGTSLMDEIDFRETDLDVLVNQIQEAMKKAFSYREDLLVSFSKTKEFADLFPECEPKEEMATRITNLDSILDNFLNVDGQIWCLDYEWVLDFPVPIRYVQYRTIHYLYMDKMAYLLSRISIEAFYAKFGYSEEDIALFRRMEQCFQWHVHGKNGSCLYLSRYEKKVRNLQDMVKHYDILETVVQGQEEEIERLRKALHNPGWVRKRLRKIITGK